MGTNENTDTVMHQSGGEKTPRRVVLNSHLTTLTASTSPCTATSAYIHRKHGPLLSQNESNSTFLVWLFLSWIPLSGSYIKQLSDRYMLQSLAKLSSSKSFSKIWSVSWTSRSSSSGRPKKTQRILPPTLLSPTINPKRQKLLKAYCLVVNIES